MNDRDINNRTSHHYYRPVSHTTLMSCSKAQSRPTQRFTSSMSRLVHRLPEGSNPNSLNIPFLTTVVQQSDWTYYSLSLLFITMKNIGPSNRELNCSPQRSDGRGSMCLSLYTVPVYAWSKHLLLDVASLWLLYHFNILHWSTLLVGAVSSPSQSQRWFL